LPLPQLRRLFFPLRTVSGQCRARRR
jgi:hypothetical protein